ncbi:MAG: PP2C family protein-serine/threonine phosphatase [Pseudomonas sp.]|nr:PP2C family protein-serine/threonine phosphatase [Pseudomonas sp.]
MQKQHTLLLDDQRAGLQLQQQIRPKTPWEAQCIKFEHCVIPALYLTGDSLDYFVLPDGRLFLYLADVSGHGTASALISMLVKNTVREFIFGAHATHSDTTLTPATVLAYLNQRLLTYDSGRHVTLICAIVDTVQNLLHWCVAGHLPSPVLFSDGRATFLRGKGQPVGLFEHATYSDEQMVLPQAFSLTLFSDGILEVLPEKYLITREAALPKLISAAQGKYTQIVQRLGLDNCSNMPDDIAMLVLSRNLA